MLSYSAGYLLRVVEGQIRGTPGGCWVRLSIDLLTFRGPRVTGDYLCERFAGGKVDVVYHSSEVPMWLIEFMVDLLSECAENGVEVRHSKIPEDLVKEHCGRIPMFGERELSQVALGVRSRL